MADFPCIPGALPAEWLRDAAMPEPDDRPRYSLDPEPKPGEVFQCVAESKLEKNIADEASLEEFSCVFKKFCTSSF